MKIPKDQINPLELINKRKRYEVNMNFFFFWAWMGVIIMGCQVIFNLHISFGVLGIIIGLLSTILYFVFLRKYEEKKIELENYQIMKKDNQENKEIDSEERGEEND